MGMFKIRRLKNSGPKGRAMSNELLLASTSSVLAGFLGHYVIEKVPPSFHTPLMAGTNAISGISLVGSLVSAGGGYGKLEHRRSASSPSSALRHQHGGRLPDHRRMLRMFKKQRPRKEPGMSLFPAGPVPDRLGLLHPGPAGCRR